MRQWYKHVVGIETTSNSATARIMPGMRLVVGMYVEDFYVPSVWRKQSDDNKQAMKVCWMIYNRKEWTMILE